MKFINNLLDNPFRWLLFISTILIISVIPLNYMNAMPSSTETTIRSQTFSNNQSKDDMITFIRQEIEYAKTKNQRLVNSITTANDHDTTLILIFE